MYLDKLSNKIDQRQVLLATGLPRVGEHIHSTVEPVFGGHAFLGAWHLPNDKIVVLFPSASLASAAHWAQSRWSPDKKVGGMSQRDLDAALEYLCVTELGTPYISDKSDSDKTRLWMDIVFVYKNQRRLHLKLASEVRAVSVQSGLSKGTPHSINHIRSRFAIATLDNHDALAKLHPAFRAAQDVSSQALKAKSDLEYKFADRSVNDQDCRHYLESGRREAADLHDQALTKRGEQNSVLATWEMQVEARQAQIEARQVAAAARQSERDVLRGDHENPSDISEEVEAYLNDMRKACIKAGHQHDF